MPGDTAPLARPRTARRLWLVLVAAAAALTSRSLPAAAAPAAAAPVHITSVTFAGSGAGLQITVRGHGFGPAPVRLPYAGDLAQFELEDVTGNWRAGWSRDPNGPNRVTLRYTRWTDTAIAVSGFGPAYGSAWKIGPRDRLLIAVWDPALAHSDTWRGPLQLPRPYGLSSLASTIVPPALAFSAPGLTIANVLISAGVVLFITFPAQLFNRTFQENYAEIRAWWERLLPGLARARERLRTEDEDPARDRRLFAAVIVLGGLFGSMLDPHFGFNRSLLTTFPAMTLAQLWGTAVAAGITFAYRWRRHGGRDLAWRLQTLPAGLGIAALCVFVSRLTRFRPGYLYGVIGGVAFARALERHEQGHVVALSTLGTMALATAAWFAWVPAQHAALTPHASIGIEIVTDFLASVFVSGLVSNVISLLPLDFMPGGQLLAWHPWVWAGAFLVTVFGMLQCMLHTVAGPTQPGGAPLFTVVVLFVGFGGGSVALRAYFVRRRQAADGAGT